MVEKVKIIKDHINTLNEYIADKSSGISEVLVRMFFFVRKNNYIGEQSKKELFEYISESQKITQELLSYSYCAFQIGQDDQVCVNYVENDNSYSAGRQSTNARVRKLANILNLSAIEYVLENANESQSDKISKILEHIYANSLSFRRLRRLTNGLKNAKISWQSYVPVAKEHISRMFDEMIQNK